MRMMTAILALALSACAQAGGDAAASRNFPVAGFDSIRVTGADDVNVVAGAASVTAAGPSEVLDRLDIRVEGTTLVIGRKNEAGWSFAGGDATVTVATPAVRSVSLTGSGDTQLQDVPARDFVGEVTGSGSLDMRGANSDRLRVELKGSGDAKLAGQAREASLATTGSGDVDAAALTAARLAVSVRGSGSVEARASGSATLAVSGSGSARVRGTRNCSITKNGSGDARCD